MSEDTQLDKLTEAYIKIRDARSQLKNEFESKDKALEESAKIIEQSMLDACKHLGADSVRTPYGTIIRSIKSRYWTNDWEAFYNLVKLNNSFELLEKRIHQTNMKTFLDENPDSYPEGLNIDREYKITVRKKS